MKWYDRDTEPGRSIGDKLWALHWPLLAIVTAISAIGVSSLYSAAGGAFEPWADQHIMRYLIGVAIVCVIAVTPPRAIMALAYPLFALSIVMLVMVQTSGVVMGGAQRWIDVGGVRFQPSEFMKIGLILALARYYQWLPPERISQPVWLIAPLAIIMLPTALVIIQPDLGTSLLFVAVGAGVIFLAGVHWGYFAGAGLLIAAAAPFAWTMLHPYQQARVMTFLDPNRDPLGAGYHITQSKIAIGSGGIVGKGFLQGTQHQLHFLPEKQTDFIFTTFAEEQGFVGALVLMGLYLALLLGLIMVGVSARDRFLRLTTMGVSLTLFIYVFVNLAMVMGVVPVVGVPLPLVSYGGSAMLTIMVALGLAMNSHVHRDFRLRRASFGPTFR